MAYYNPDHYGWSISTSFYEEEEEEEEDSPPRKQKNNKNNVVTSEKTALKRKKFTRKRSAIKNVEKRAESQTPITEAIERYFAQFDDKGDD